MIGNFVWASSSRGGKFGGSSKKFSWREEGAKGQVRLLTRGPAELGAVASGSATQELWLGDRKVRSLVIG